MKNTPTNFYTVRAMLKNLAIDLAQATIVAALFAWPFFVYFY